MNCGLIEVLEDGGAVSTPPPTPWENPGVFTWSGRLRCLSPNAREDRAVGARYCWSHDELLIHLCEISFSFELKVKKQRSHRTDCGTSFFDDSDDEWLSFMNDSALLLPLLDNADGAFLAIKLAKNSNSFFRGLCWYCWCCL